MKLIDITTASDANLTLFDSDSYFKQTVASMLSAVSSKYPRIWTELMTDEQKPSWHLPKSSLSISKLSSDISLLKTVLDYNSAAFEKIYKISGSSIYNASIVFITAFLLNDDTQTLIGANQLNPNTFPVTGSIIGVGDGSDKKQSYTGYAGCTITPIVLMGSYTITIPEITTVSYSTHAETFDVTPLGFSERIGTTSGPRTIAGSIIAQALREEPLQGLQPQNIIESRMLNPSGDPENPVRENLLPDQLPLFDLFLFIQTEDGHQAISSLYGVKISRTGITNSSQDTAVEFTYQYTATSLDPLSYIGKVDKDDSNGQIGFDISLYKERIKNIDIGNTVHATSSTDLQEFWDVIDNESGVISAPKSTYDFMTQQKSIKISSTDGNIKDTDFFNYENS